MLDGAWGVLLQGRGLSEADYRGERFAGHPRDVARRPRPAQPDAAGHRRARCTTRYFAAGADITTTNTFTATSIGQADYGLEDARLRDERRRRADRARGRRADRLRRRLGRAAERHALAQPEGRRPGLPHAHVRPGRGGRTPSRSAALAEGGVDLLLIETIFDTLNAKAAIAAAREAAPRAAALDLASRSSTSPAGRSRGQTIEAFWASIEHADPLIVGVNCSLGAREMRPYVAELARIAPCLVARAPERRPAERVRRLRRDAGRDERACCASSRATGFLNVAGCCCGSTPEHTARDRRRDARARAARARRRARRAPRFSGLEPFEIGRDTGFVLIGERTNVTGSARFRRLIEARRLRRRRRGRARAGARRREPARREHGRRPARERAGDAHVPERDRDRARGRAPAGDGRQLALVGARGGAAVRSRARGSSTRSASRRARRSSSSRRAGSATTARASS